MKEIFKQLIIDFHQEGIPTPYPRVLELPHLPPNVRKALVFIGMRRSGKTWSLYQIMHSLQAQGTPQNQMVYFNFEDDRLNNIKVSDLQSILDAYFELYPNNIQSEDLHLFLDEIHEVEGWEKFVRRILDQEKIHLYLTGSSAKQLSKEIATALRGRNLVREIFPFSFKEYLDMKGIDQRESPSSKQKAELQHHLLHFLEYGGFPETLNASIELHRELLQGYMDSVIYRDIIERHKITQSTVLRSFLRSCLKNAASTLSIHKVYQSFKSQGFKVSKNTLYDFMNYFEDAYCLFSLPIFHFSERKTASKLSKIYPVDQGLITAFTLKHDYEHAARFETAVFCKLRREIDEIYYYQTTSGKEIDFLTKEPNGSIKLYQACISMSDPKTKAREINALIESMQELKLSQGMIITLDEEETLEYKEGKIDIIPAWRFL